MADSFSERLSSLSAGDISAIIQMAWEDRTSFETIEERTGWAEADVIRLMRHELRPQSFRLWRQRMQGRVTKHRDEIPRPAGGRSPTAELLNVAVIDPYSGSGDVACPVTGNAT